MIVNNEILSNIKERLGSTKYRKAHDLVDQKKVVIVEKDYIDDENFTIKARIRADEEYTCSLTLDDGNFTTRQCSCKTYEANAASYCIHMAASVLEFNKHDEYAKEVEDEEESDTNSEEEKDYSYSSIKKVSKEMKYKHSNQLFNLFTPNYSSRKHDKDLLGEVRIIPELEYNTHNNTISCTFKIGTTVTYKIKDIEDFYIDMIENRNTEYGKSLKFIHKFDKFNERSAKLAKLIMDYGRMLHIFNKNPDLTYKFGTVHKDNIELTGPILDSFFEIMAGEEVAIEGIYHTEKLTITDEKPPISFKIEETVKGDYALIGSFSKHNKTFQGEKYIYFINEGVVYRCLLSQYNDLFKVLSILDESPSKQITFEKEKLASLFSLVVPCIRDNFDFSNIIDTPLECYMPQPLSVKVYLDATRTNDIEAQVIFNYNDIEFNPLDKDIDKDITRNLKDEMEVLDYFTETGFVESENKTFILHKEEDIYNFLTEEIMVYMKKFEVLSSDAFNKKQIVKAKISKASVRIDNNLLELNFDNLGYSQDELKSIIEGYKDKKKYVRLKNGAFLSLDENDELEFISDLTRAGEVEISDILNGRITLPAYRGLYLDKMLDKLKNTTIEKDKTYKKVIDKFKTADDQNIKLPKELDNTLRVYQKDGFKWLSVLNEYQFGGILADDMGLGKTLQVITLIQVYVKGAKAPDKKTSLVVCPSSLMLNWKSEFEKFAPSIKVAVMRGKADERKELFSTLEDYDVLITSYDLLKRDISLFTKEDYTFQYIIADEAQYIKNAATKNSQALKKIKALTRFALTGTPIENSLSELWSIFDFVMPGYLFTYSKFKKNYELPIMKDENYYATESLKKQIEPFVLRRLKKDVLTELPDKTITILKNEMDETQRKTYLAYLAKAKEELITEINQRGVEKSQVKILSLLTRLRQICCHPSLFIENYKGESSKFNQCIEIINESIESGHKILLFSQYTSMFEFFEKAFEEMGIKYFKLTGSTKINERITLVDDFNSNNDIKVFLISLRAGGTGLNLTGADVVMHYDPWWNLSAENQATDRAYRIGQQNNVQVYKFITENSIEEKINQIQERKAKLSTDILSTEKSFISAMSKDDILKLFEE